jgi:hypothetical protein
MKKIFQFNAIQQSYQKRKRALLKMKQCKICGSPLGKEPTTEELESHWKKHHSWHWESNNEKTPEDALLKKQS